MGYALYGEGKKHITVTYIDTGLDNMQANITFCDDEMEEYVYM